jgi:Uma2 family endonuclease
MALQIPRRLFSTEEYERMIAAGVFPEDDRSELIRGEVVAMAPIGLRHAACVGRLTKLLERMVGDVAIVWVQNPIRLTGNSLPQPDLALLKSRSDYYEQSRPMPSDIYLVVEVSDSTVESDVQVKVPLYAEANISEVWVVNLQENIIEIYSTPSAGAYGSVQRVTRGQSIQLSGELSGTITVDNILG